MKNRHNLQTRCTACSETMSVHANNCPQCDTPIGLEALAGVDPNMRIKNQKLAICFGLLLGGLGLHKFYLGHHLKGSLYLLFSWTLVPIVVGWVDSIRTFKMSPFRFAQQYNQIKPSRLHAL